MQMKRRPLIATLFLLFAILSANAGPVKYVIGSVHESDGNRKDIPHCTVELLAVGDSSVIASTQTRALSGKFGDSISFRLPVQNDSSYILRFSMVGYETLYKPVRVEVAPSVKEYSIGRIFLDRAEHVLDEVVVKATKIKMVMRGDTIVYNADAFNVGDGSMLDALIRQLPGCRLDHGVIYVNGRRVESLLVNGRKFFTGDAKLALEHLPAYTVDKVKVYDHSGEASRLMGEDMGDKSLVVDVALKKKYTVGWLNTMTAAYGTKGRYGADVSSMLFKKKVDVMLGAGADNTGSDNWQEPLSAATNGDKRRRKVSLNFSRNGKTFDDRVSSSTTFSNVRNHTLRVTNTEQFLADGDLFGASSADNRGWGNNLTTRNQFRRRLKQQIVTANLAFRYGNSRERGLTRSGLFNSEPADYRGLLDSLFLMDTRHRFYSSIVNRTGDNSLQREHSVALSANFSDRIAFGKSKGRYRHTVNLMAKGYYSDTKSRRFSLLNTDYLQGSATHDNRDRFYDSPSSAYDFSLTADYGLRLSSKLAKRNSLFGYLEYSFDRNYNSRWNTLYRLDQLSDYDEARYVLGMLPSTRDALMQVLDAANSSHAMQWKTSNTLTYKLNYVRSRGYGYPRLTVKAELPLNWVDERLRHFQEEHRQKTRSSLLFQPKASLSYEHNDSIANRSMELEYSSMEMQPSLTSLLALTNDDDPLRVRLGNSQLKRERLHSMGLTLSRTSTGSGNTTLKYSASASIRQNAQGTSVTYDRTTGRTVSQPVNVNGNWDGLTSLSWGRGIGSNHELDVNASVNGSYSHNVDLNFVDGYTSGRSTVRRTGFGGQASISYQPGMKFNAMLVGSVTRNRTTGSRADFETINSTDIMVQASVMVMLPWELRLSTDAVDYKATGYNDSRMNENSLLWNAALSRSFLKKSLTLSVEAFDILGQVKNRTVMLDSQARSEVWVNSVSRYVWLKVGYKFNVGMKQ